MGAIIEHKCPMQLIDLMRLSDLMKLIGPMFRRGGADPCSLPVQILLYVSPCTVATVVSGADVRW